MRKQLQNDTAAIPITKVEREYDKNVADLKDSPFSSVKGVVVVGTGSGNVPLSEMFVHPKS